MPLTTYSPARYSVRMILRLSTLAAAVFISATPLFAQEFSATPAGALIAQYESDGGRNIPNFKFDRRHTAGGEFQITDENWRAYAPTVGIDLATYPNAMSAPEKLQGQVAGKMWAEQGFMPWTCCNKQLRDHLAQQQQPQPVKVRRANERPERPASAISAQSPPHAWDVFSDEPDEEQQPPLVPLQAANSEEPQ
jgi:hypothetical protein